MFDAFASFRDQLTALGGYLGERAADLDDVAQRVIARLRGVPAPGVPDPGHPFVLVAKDLAPADTALLDLDKVLALVTTEGGPTSHTAILAREKSIVAIVGVAAAKDLREGETVIVDAAAGVVTTEPDRRGARPGAQPRRRTGRPPRRRRSPTARSPTARRCRCSRTSASPDGAADAVALGAEGVGLFRTEFLFLSSAQAPTVEQQREAYTKLLSAFPGKKVVVRVLDAGADKPLRVPQRRARREPGARTARPPCPAGERGHPARAAHRARRSGCRDPADARRPGRPVGHGADGRDGRRDRVLHRHRQATTASRPPASWSRCRRRRCSPTGSSTYADFASIGTNDLTQYTLAADRLLGSVASFQDPWHPAVLRLIREVGDAGRIHGKPVGICGEAAADPLLAVVLVGLGATSLSMAPTALADVRASLLKHSLDDARVIAEAALAANSAATARDAARAAATQHSTAAATR